MKSLILIIEELIYGMVCLRTFQKMGMHWLVVLEPFVNKISKEYDILVPDIYQSKMIDAQSEVWSLNSENVELKKMNEKLSQNI